MPSALLQTPLWDMGRASSGGPVPVSDGSSQGECAGCSAADAGSAVIDCGEPAPSASIPA